MRKILLGIILASGCIAPALARNYIEFPAPTPGYPFQRSMLIGRALVIPPYDKPFPVRAYHTPSQPPYYNVPPYAVVAPY